MVVSRTNLRLKTDFTAMIGEPPGAGTHVLFMLWLGGHAGKAQKLAQLGDEAVLVAFQVIEHDLHGD
jgi:hypothetical protein